jgi:hypothetical protein
VVRNLAAFNGVVIVLLVAYAWFLKMPLVEIIPLVLTAILASIPVALPATFTLASALGARALARRGVLPTRLSAVDEAASMVVLCADKTGTLTQNALTVTTVRPMSGFDEAHVLALTALASSDGGQDPVDGAIRTAAIGKAISDAPKLIKFAAFDPAKKMSEATATDSSGNPQRIVKGAFAVVIGVVQSTTTATAAAKELEDKGFRVPAVAAGAPTAMKLAGLIALSDPPRKDSAALIPNCMGWACARSWSRAMRQRRRPSSRKPWGSTGPSVLPGRFLTLSRLSSSQSSRASCREISSSSLRRFRQAGTPSACAATARTMPRRSARHRWALPSRRRPTSVLIVRVHREILLSEGLPDTPKDDQFLWHNRYRSIAHLERHLHENGTRIIKFYLHLSEEEQRQRFLARIDEPEKNWKFRLADIEERKFWKRYMKAYEECLSATSTRDAPWYVVPADDKENARLIVSQIILDTLEGLGMSYPKTTDERRQELLEIREQLTDGEIKP